jgi:hypothetical protein
MFYLPKQILAICLIIFLSGCLVGPYGTSGRVVVQDDQARVDISFSDHDRDILREHYGYKHQSKYKKMPPGLAKKNKLPPGIQKQLIRNGQLPPGLNYRRLPDELERRMSRLPDGYIRVMIDESFILFNKSTRVIFDVIHDL